MERISGTNVAFAWVDDYVSHMRPHFHVREADSLLIVMPNRAAKLNPSGLKALRFLADGGSIDAVLQSIGDDADRRHELFCFLCDFRSLMLGCIGEGRGRKAVETVPHTEVFNCLPVLSEVAVTYKCNLRCRFCYAACGCRRSDGGKDMSTAEVVRVLKVIRNDAGVPSVSFTGGEPLVRPDLEELVVEAVAAGLRVNLITNGVLLAGNDRAGRLKKAGLVSAQVSLEGPSAEVHDNLTQVPGSFEKTIEGLAALRAAGIHVHTNTTVTTQNAEHLVDLVRLLSELRMTRMSMNMVIPAGNAGDLGLQVTYRDVWKIVEPVRAEARKHGVEFMWYSPTPMCILNPLAEGLGNKSCAACDGLLSVSPTGDALPCSSYAEPVGNLLEESFEEVWQSARATFFRRKEYAPAECEGCEEFGACAGACPLYWSAVGTRELADAGRRSHAVA